jgi:hypothetical protein
MLFAQEPFDNAVNCRMRQIAAVQFRILIRVIRGLSKPPMAAICQSVRRRILQEFTLKRAAMDAEEFCRLGNVA